MKIKSSDNFFICSIANNLIKIVKCLSVNKVKTEFADLAVEAITGDLIEGAAAERFTAVFKKLQYNHEPVIFCLPRHKGIIRHIKIPSQKEAEIEKIILLQAPRYLPYKPEELITGYQGLSVDSKGYSDINLTVVHENEINKYVGLAKELKASSFSIIFSSLGLVNLYNYIEAGNQKPVALVNLDEDEIEIVIAEKEKLLFSRSVKLQQEQSFCADEINKSIQAYLKEEIGEEPLQIIIFGNSGACNALKNAITEHSNRICSTLVYWEKVSYSANFLNKIGSRKDSFTSLLGLGLKDMPASLNLLPRNLKNEARLKLQSKKRFKAGALIFLTILFWSLALVKNLSNKDIYLKNLKIQLDNIEKEARPLAGLDRYLQIVKKESSKKPSSLEALSEIYKIVPDRITLDSLNYEVSSQLTLRGQAQELSVLFYLVDRLEKSPVFNNFSIKINYATKKPGRFSEVSDFEIVCLKKK